MNAFAYMRCSGRGQIDGDTWERQEAAINAYAKTQGISVLIWFRDEGIPGKTELIGRDGMTACIEQCRHHGITTVLVESADRLARDLIVAELLIREFQKAGVTVWSASGGVNLTDGNDGNPTAKLIRQILSAIAEFDRNVTVLKLRGARQRKKAKTGRCEGRKPFGSLPGEEQILCEIRHFRKSGMTTNAMAAYLNAIPHLPTRSGKPWSGSTIRKILRNEANRADNHSS